MTGSFVRGIYSLRMAMLSCNVLPANDGYCRPRAESSWCNLLMILKQFRGNRKYLTGVQAAVHNMKPRTLGPTALEKAALALGQLEPG